MADSVLDRADHNAHRIDLNSKTPRSEGIRLVLGPPVRRSGEGGGLQPHRSEPEGRRFKSCISSPDQTHRRSLRR